MLLIIVLAPKGLVMGAIGDTPLNLKTPLLGLFWVLKKPNMDPYHTPEESHIYCVSGAVLGYFWRVCFGVGGLGPTAGGPGGLPRENFEI